MNIVLAGCEGIEKSIIAKETGCKFLLSSYYHLFYKGSKSNSDRWVKFYHENKHNINFIIDSGLFTMMFGAGRNNVYTKEDLLKYTDKYLETINKIGYEDYIVEMDVHKILGINELQIFREKMCQKYNPNKIIFVFHYEEGFKNWKELVKKYNFIAISIPELRIIYKNQKEKIIQLIKTMIKEARVIKPNINIHLLGCTQSDFMLQNGYTTADSTSWTFGGRSGKRITFNRISKKMECNNFDYRKAKNDLYDQKLFINFKNVIQKEFFRYKGVIPTEKQIKYFFTDYWNAIQFIELNKYINQKYYKNKSINKNIKNK